MIRNLVREGDPATSYEAAIKAKRASRKAAQTIRAVMVDGIERIDEEIWLECRRLGMISSLAVVQHARLALSDSGLVVDTGGTRMTSQKSRSRIWRTTEPVTRKEVTFAESATPNVRHELAAKQQELSNLEQGYLHAVDRLQAAAEKAQADLLAAREEGIFARESAARIRAEAIYEALLILVEAL